MSGIAIGVRWKDASPDVLANGSVLPYGVVYGEGEKALPAAGAMAAYSSCSWRVLTYPWAARSRASAKAMIEGYRSSGFLDNARSTTCSTFSDSAAFLVRRGAGGTSRCW